MIAPAGRTLRGEASTLPQGLRARPGDGPSEGSRASHRVSSPSKGRYPPWGCWPAIGLLHDPLAVHPLEHPWVQRGEGVLRPASKGLPRVPWLLLARVFWKSTRLASCELTTCA